MASTINNKENMGENVVPATENAPVEPGPKLSVRSRFLKRVENK